MEYINDLTGVHSSKNFTADEFADKHALGWPLPSEGINQGLINALQFLRDKFGMPIRITSGYRTRETQEHIYVMRYGLDEWEEHMPQFSYHEIGDAADFQFIGKSGKAIVITYSHKIAIMNSLKYMHDSDGNEGGVYMIDKHTVHMQASPDLWIGPGFEGVG